MAIIFGLEIEGLNMRHLRSSILSCHDSLSKSTGVRHWHQMISDYYDVWKKWYVPYHVYSTLDLRWRTVIDNPQILSIKQFETHLINILNTSYACEENLLEYFENVIQNAKIGVFSIHVFKVQKKEIHEL